MYLLKLLTFGVHQCSNYTQISFITVLVLAKFRSIDDWKGYGIFLYLFPFAVAVRFGNFDRRKFFGLDFLSSSSSGKLSNLSALMFIKAWTKITSLDDVFILIGCDSSPTRFKSSIKLFPIALKFFFPPDTFYLFSIVLPANDSLIADIWLNEMNFNFNSGIASKMPRWTKSHRFANRHGG